MQYARSEKQICELSEGSVLEIKSLETGDTVFKDTDFLYLDINLELEFFGEYPYFLLRLNETFVVINCVTNKIQDLDSEDIRRLNYPMFSFKFLYGVKNISFEKNKMNCSLLLQESCLLSSRWVRSSFDFDTLRFTGKDVVEQVSENIDKQIERLLQSKEELCKKFSD